MSPAIKILLQSVVTMLIARLKDDGVGYTKAKAAKAYVLSIQTIREQLTLLVTLMTCTTFVAGGFFLSVLGLSYILPFSLEGQGIFLLCVGLVTAVAPVLVFKALNSEKRWIEKTHIDEITQEAVADSRPARREKRESSVTTALPATRARAAGIEA